MKAISDIESLNDLIHDYSARDTITNNYVFTNEFAQHIANKNLFFITEKHNACILVKKTGFYKLFYFINNKNELMLNGYNLPVVMEIIYRGALQRPLEAITYWEKCGFKQHLTRDLLTATYKQLIPAEKKSLNIQIKYADTEEEMLYSKELIENTFDKYTGDILTYQEVKYFAENKSIICAYFRGNISGVLQSEKKHNVVWLGHIAVAPEYRGNGIADALVDAYIENNKSQPDTRYHLWVIQDNSKATTLYNKFGFVYGNKTSASMLRCIT
ncbi:MAG: GNAT family N-acetyltransferase [Bacteroidales bacterium]|nr:GNAT family N-acetyltransferase [Bacteroidales bacterium]